MARQHRKSRETTGLSGDGRRFYYKTMDGELAAIDTSAERYRELWCTDLGWGYEVQLLPGIRARRRGLCRGPSRHRCRHGRDGTLLWSVKCCNSGGNDFAQAPDGSCGRPSPKARSSGYHKQAYKSYF
ncbi:MAG: hypothetical protein ACLRMJ_10405 [Alistipes finegoldii]